MEHTLKCVLAILLLLFVKTLNYDSFLRLPYVFPNGRFREIKSTESIFSNTFFRMAL